LSVSHKNTRHFLINKLLAWFMSLPVLD